MPSDVVVFRELARAWWAGREVTCPRHPDAALAGTFVQTTFADHLSFTCAKGRETFAVPQRPKQVEFQPQQVEGLIENLERGDSVLCYRCQSPVEVETTPDAITFTCIRCFSWGAWRGRGE